MSQISLQGRARCFLSRSLTGSFLALATASCFTAAAHRPVPLQTLDAVSIAMTTPTVEDMPPTLATFTEPLFYQAILEEAQAACDPQLDTGKYRLSQILNFRFSAGQFSELLPAVQFVTSFLAEKGVRVCYDRQLTGTPMTAVLHMTAGTIALNPQPSGIDNNAVQQELNLLDAAIKMKTLVQVFSEKKDMNWQIIKNPIGIIPVTANGEQTRFVGWDDMLTRGFNVRPPLKGDAPLGRSTHPIVPRDPSIAI